MPAGYEALPQSEDELDVNGQNDVVKSKRGELQCSQKPGHIDLRKLDNAFKR